MKDRIRQICRRPFSRAAHVHADTALKRLLGAYLLFLGTIYGKPLLTDSDAFSFLFMNDNTILLVSLDGQEISHEKPQLTDLLDVPRPVPA